MCRLAKAKVFGFAPDWARTVAWPCDAERETDEVAAEVPPNSVAAVAVGLTHVAKRHR